MDDLLLASSAYQAGLFDGVCQRLGHSDKTRIMCLMYKNGDLDWTRPDNPTINPNAQVPMADVCPHALADWLRGNKEFITKVLPNDPSVVDVVFIIFNTTIGGARAIGLII